jgi:hypothetical protein
MAQFKVSMQTSWAKLEPVVFKMYFNSPKPSKTIELKTWAQDMMPCKQTTSFLNSWAQVLSVKENGPNCELLANTNAPFQVGLILGPFV